MNQQKLETITLLAEAAVSVANALNKLVDYTTAQGIVISAFPDFGKLKSPSDF